MTATEQSGVLKEVSSQNFQGGQRWLRGSFSTVLLVIVLVLLSSPKLSKYYWKW